MRGVLAAWLADECLLGREDQGWERVKAIRKRGVLGPNPTCPAAPQGKAYVRELRVLPAEVRLPRLNGLTVRGDALGCPERHPFNPVQ